MVAKVDLVGQEGKKRCRTVGGDFRLGLDGWEKTS